VRAGQAVRLNGSTRRSGTLKGFEDQLPVFPRDSIQFFPLTGTEGMIRAPRQGFAVGFPRRPDARPDGAFTSCSSHSLLLSKMKLRALGGISEKCGKTNWTEKLETDLLLATYAVIASYCCIIGVWSELPTAVSALP
jgi:hypothetical protein